MGLSARPAVESAVDARNSRLEIMLFILVSVELYKNRFIPKDN